MTQSKMIFIGQKELYNVFSNYSPDLLDFQNFMKISNRLMMILTMNSLMKIHVVL